MHKRLSKVIIVLLILLSSCSKNNNYTRSLYHKDLIEFLNLESEEDLVAFKIIDQDYEDQALDNKYFLYTLANYINSPSKFVFEEEDYIDYVINIGLISKYENKYIKKDEAQQLFVLAEQLKNKEIGNYDNSIYKESIDDDAEIEDIYETIDFEYNGELDFKDADIVEYFNFLPNELEEDENYTMLGETLASKSYTLGDYKISYVVTSSNIKVKAETKKLNGTFFVQSEINNINLKTKIKADEENDYTYVKFDFKTNESLGFRKGTYKDRYADLKGIDKDNIVNSLSKMFKTKSEIAETSIELFEIKMPIDSLGVLKATIQVKLHFYASGRVELTFNTTNSYGFERIDGNVRFINEVDKDLNFMVRASTNATLSLTLGIKAGKTRIADIRFEAGVSGYIKSQVHIYDGDNYKSVETALPSDYVLEMLEDDTDFKVCTDLSLYWLFKVIINSSGTLFSKVGLSKTFDIFGENKQLIKGPIHLENFLEVDKCTVSKKTKTSEKTEEKDTSKLAPSIYFKSLKVKESFQIDLKEIPNNYKESDIEYLSSNSLIAEVTSGGLIVAISPGSVEITIQTKDKKYKTSMSVLVNE